MRARRASVTWGLNGLPSKESSRVASSSRKRAARCSSSGDRAMPSQSVASSLRPNVPRPAARSGIRGTPAHAASSASAATRALASGTSPRNASVRWRARAARSAPPRRPPTGGRAPMRHRRIARAARGRQTSSCVRSFACEQRRQLAVREDDEGAGGARERGVEAPARERVVGGEDALGRVGTMTRSNSRPFASLSVMSTTPCAGSDAVSSASGGASSPSSFCRRFASCFQGAMTAERPLVIARCGHGFAQRGSIGHLVGAGNDGRRLVGPLDG